MSETVPVQITVNGERRTARVEPACCWCTTCATSSGSPALTSGVTRPTAAPARSTSTNGLEGNLCRCTGYHNIVRAIEEAAAHGEGAAREAREVRA